MLYIPRASFVQPLGTSMPALIVKTWVQITGNRHDMQNKKRRNAIRPELETWSDRTRVKQLQQQVNNKQANNRPAFSFPSSSFHPMQKHNLRQPSSGTDRRRYGQEGAAFPSTLQCILFFLSLPCVIFWIPPSLHCFTSFWTLAPQWEMRQTGHAFAPYPC